MATQDLDAPLAAEIAAVEPLVQRRVRTPGEWFDDVIRRRKPSHKELTEQAFAQHTPVIALLLTEAVRQGHLSNELVGDIETILTVSRLRDWAKSHPEIELASTLPLPEVITTPAGVPGNAELGQLMTFRMAYLARRVLREHQERGEDY